MASIPQKELRNNVGEVLRRAEAGERITITVNGRPVAELGPVPKRQWVSPEESKVIWDSPAPDYESFMEDIRSVGGGLADPFDD